MFLPMVRAWAKDKGVVLHEEDQDFTSEFLALEMNVAIVKGVDEAIEHINRYGSHHSDCIVANDGEKARTFLRDVDSAAVYHNVSTRFTDGSEFGMGAEIGISTDKLHARGPMGLEELTTYKYVITGDGVVRS
jgi:glutamate-5-semialdehyde dehydrogenase